MQKEIDYVETAVTKTGLPLHIRQIHRGEAVLLVELLNHMSEQSRYQRFLQTVEHISEKRIWAEAEQVARASDAGDICLGGFVAVAAGEPLLVGAARYVHTAPTVAELAMSVRDDYQNQGVGTQLLQALLVVARAEGVVELLATVQNDNDRMLHLLQKLKRPFTRELENSSSLFTLDLTP